jgi:hypothetical protein
MIAFHTATAQALAAKNGDKDSKLTVAKKKILQACCGHADKNTFTTPGVYLDMDVEGGTTDALGRILQRWMKFIVGSPHKSNMYVTPQLVATTKLLSFAANGDKTHAGCTKGITPFGTPWRSVKAMNEDTDEEGYFDQATLKSPADICKHATSAKVELPTTHLGLVCVLNNYTRLLEVLFGDDCDHLVHVWASGMDWKTTRQIWSLKLPRVPVSTFCGESITMPDNFSWRAKVGKMGKSSQGLNWD